MRFVVACTDGEHVVEVRHGVATAVHGDIAESALAVLADEDVACRRTAAAWNNLDLGHGFPFLVALWDRALIPAERLQQMREGFAPDPRLASFGPPAFATRNVRARAVAATFLDLPWAVRRALVQHLADRAFVGETAAAAHRDNLRLLARRCVDRGVEAPQVPA